MRRCYDKCDMEVKIEIGHRALKNIKPTKEGYTHDWTVFVQGASGNEIKYIVENVIFHLPDSYPDSKIIKEKPPFVLSESTSQNISIQIEVYFCKEAKLKKVNYIYDICINDDEVNTLWTRKLTFPNPSKEFEKKLLLAGGELVDTTAPPVMTGALLTCKVERVDYVDDVVLNTSTQDTDNLQNSKVTLTSSAQDTDNLQNCNEELSSCDKLLEENETLKNANMELKEKINLQEKLIVPCEEQVSHYETSILNANVDINQLKKKIEADEREISILELQVQMLKNKLLRMKIHPPECPEEKNEEELNMSAAVGKEKENIIQSMEFMSSTSSRSQNSLIFENTFDSVKNQNVTEHVESKSITSVVQESSHNRSTVEFNELCNTLQESCPLSQLRNETQSLNNSFFNFINTCDVEESVKDNSIETNATLSKSHIISNDAEDFVYGSSVEANSSLNTSEIKVMNAEHSKERNSVNSNTSLNKFDMENEDVEKAIFGSIMEYLNSPEKITVDSETSAKGVVVKADASLNKFNTKNNDAEEVVEGNFLDASAIKMQSCNANKTQDEFDIPVQEQCALPIKKMNTESYNSNCKENGQKLPECGDIASSTLTSKDILLPKKKKRKKTRKERILKRKSFVMEKFPSKTKRKIMRKRLRYQMLEQFELNQQVSLNKKENIESFYANFKDNCQTLSHCNDLISAQAPSNKQKPNKWKKVKNVQNFKNVFPGEHLHFDSICKQSHQDINDTYLPKLNVFLTQHCEKLAIELYRIKNSEFNKYREGTNPLFFMLGNIDTGPISDACIAQHVQSLIDYFSDPKKLDMPSLIFLVVDYLYRERPQHDSLFTYFQNQDLYVYIPYSESCVVRAVVEIEKKSLPHLNGLGRNVLNIIHEVIISKKKMPLNGLASLCRVFMEMCKCYNDRWEVLFLCCELLRLGHPFAPYLINALAAVWRDPFSLNDSFSVEENMLLSSIFYGMEEKPLLMDSDLWARTLKLRSAYFPHPLVTDPNQAIEFLTSEIVSRCAKQLFQNLWMLTKALVIYVSRQTWDWKMHFRNKYIFTNLLHFSNCFNEHGFDLFCNLHVDISIFCNVSPYEELLQFFTKPGLLHQVFVGTKFLQDSAAVSVLKYVGITDKHIPAPLRDWFLRNIDNPKLAKLLDLYCKKVMESHDNLLLWDDIIIL
ncbi:uncharacterized protein LOC129956462 isoform X1 [Argiope bruennichi]|uniref:uncharacterized protein LOC129956462 isoform X1 n=2 Tax=Argiope bruennichi TaxID=94029 RepID=UPI002494FD38|nr:uncharacterized protein LOC129956462 isoform X1 [Argiope bruennichi]